jgi:hypothetical protein
MDNRTAISINDSIYAVAGMIQGYNNVAIHDYIVVDTEQVEKGSEDIASVIAFGEDQKGIDYMFVPVGQQFKDGKTAHAIWLVYDMKKKYIIELNSLGSGSYDEYSADKFNKLFKRAAQRHQWTHVMYSKKEVQGPFGMCRLSSVYLLEMLLNNKKPPTNKILQTLPRQQAAQNKYINMGVFFTIPKPTRRSARNRIIYRPSGEGTTLILGSKPVEKKTSFSQGAEEFKQPDSELSAFTVKELQKELRKRGLQVSGKKDVLVNRLSEHMDELSI